MGYLIDTCIFIRQERNKGSLNNFLSKYPNEKMAISAITAAELLHGVFRAKDDSIKNKRKAFVESILDHVPILNFNLGCARIYAEVWAQLLSKGKTVSPHDLQIGCTALCVGMKLLTYNKKDFLSIPGLEIESFT